MYRADYLLFGTVEQVIRYRIFNLFFLIKTKNIEGSRYLDSN